MDSRIQERGRIVVLNEATKAIDALQEYWQSDHWQRFLHLLLEEDGERVYHIHHFVDTRIHPESLQQAVQFYFAKHGWEIDREIDTYVQVPRPVGTIHGICAINAATGQKMPHWDLQFRYGAGAFIAPMAADGTKEDLTGWSESWMEKFLSQFPFEPVGPKEEAIIEDWFHSGQWDRACAHVEDPKAVHVHANAITSVHPDAVIKAALRAFKREGWRVWDYVPCVFDVRGETVGKTVFMLSYPQQIFDICWRFEPGVVMAPSPKHFLVDRDPEFDVRTQGPLEAFIASNDYVRIPREALREAIG